MQDFSQQFKKYFLRGKHFLGKTKNALLNEERFVFYELRFINYNLPLPSLFGDLLRDGGLASKRLALLLVLAAQAKPKPHNQQKQKRGKRN